MRFVHWLVQLLLPVPKFPGRDYLIVKLPKLFLKKVKVPIVVHSRFGFKIEVDPGHDINIEKVIYERGVYELGTVRFMQEHLQKGDFFIDVGANIGFLSLVAAAAVGKEGRVLAFEPVPSSRAILERNCSLNEFAQINIEPFALGNETSKGLIYPEHNNRGGASISNKRSEEGISIDIQKLDDFTFDRRIKMMKVDVEGFEFEVLKGAKASILKDKPILIVEYSSNRNNKGDAYEMFKWINSLDIYTVYRFKGGKERSSTLIPVIAKTAGLPEHDNIICLPKDK